MAKFRVTPRNYHLVNPTGQRITVLAPPLRGINRDGKNDKDKDGNTIRNFFIIDSTGVDTFKDKTDVVLTGSDDSLPYTIIDGVRWQLTVIEGVHASRPRTKKINIETVAADAPVTENSAEDVKATPVEAVAEASTSTEVTTASTDDN